ncbi:SDR family oxidoreductase [Microbacterium indicum]|uniref:SDR family oxidoreductase n=1 Tax=Microbacterium indicum TaxID=358100 RepID=UPI00040D644A|nr:SDR family oxidoreductase [Microbacterium indicum]
MARTIDITVPDLADRRAVVTGASDGMGLHIATRLAAAGAEVILPVRSPRKGEAALAAIRARVPGARVSLRSLDLASLESVRELGAALREEAGPIHLLILNAGVMQPPERRTTADGFELQLGTNHLAHVLLVAELLPLLIAGSARVVSQISVAAASGEIRWDDLNSERGYDGMAAYRQSKIALGLFATELQRRSEAEGWGITSVLSHPGIAPTNLLAARPEMGRSGVTFGGRVVRVLARIGLANTPETAGLPALVAATNPAASPGALYGPSGPGHIGGRPAEQRMYRPIAQGDGARVWRESAKLTGARFA